MSAERVKNNKAGWKQALSLAEVENEDSSLYLCCAALTKALQTEIEGDGWKTKTLIVQQSSFTIAEEANKKSTVLP